LVIADDDNMPDSGPPPFLALLGDHREGVTAEGFRESKIVEGFQKDERNKNTKSGEVVDRCDG